MFIFRCGYLLIWMPCIKYGHGDNFWVKERKIREKQNAQFLTPLTTVQIYKTTQKSSPNEIKMKCATQRCVALYLFHVLQTVINLPPFFKPHDQITP